MKININDDVKLVNALQSAQSRAWARVIDAGEIVQASKEIEKRFKILGVSLANAQNAEFLYENGHKMPSSYNGRPESTQFRLRRGAKDWFVTEIYRGGCNHKRECVFVNEEKYKQFYKFYT